MSLQQKKVAFQVLILLNIIVIFFSYGNGRTLFWLTAVFVILNISSIKLTFEIIEKNNRDIEYIKGVRKRQDQLIKEINSREDN